MKKVIAILASSALAVSLLTCATTTTNAAVLDSKEVAKVSANAVKEQKWVERKLGPPVKSRTQVTDTLQYTDPSDFHYRGKLNLVGIEFSADKTFMFGVYQGFVYYNHES